MAIDITDHETVQRIIQDIESSQVQCRVSEEWKAWACYGGAVEQYVKERLEEQFPEDHKVMETSDVNIIKKVVDKLARSYKDGVIRTLDDEAKTDEYQDIAKTGLLDEAMSVFDRCLHISKYCALWVVKIEGEIKFKVVQPYVIHPIINQDTGKLEAMVLNYPNTNTLGTALGNDTFDQIVAESPADSSSEQKVYAIWTATQHAAWRSKTTSGVEGLKTQIDFVPVEGNEDNINPLGIIPFIYRSTDYGVELPIKSPLKDQTVRYNVLMSHALTAASRQGFGQLLISAPQGTKLEKLSTGFSVGMNLPQPAEGEGNVTAEYINPSPDLQGQLQVYMAYLQQTLSTYGIKGEGIVGGNVAEFSSGLERLIANADVSDHVKQVQKMMVGVEQDVLDIVSAYLSLDGRNPFSEEDKVHVIYKKPKALISDVELLNNIEKRMSLGLMGRVEALMELDPNISREQAEEKSAQIDAEKKSIISTFMGEAVANNQNKDKL